MFAVLPFVWTTPDSLRDILFFCSLGVLGALGHYFVARALTYAPANIVAPFQYMQLLGSVAVGYFFFGDFPDIWGWVGAAIIVASGPLYRLVAEKGLAWARVNRHTPHPEERAQRASRRVGSSKTVSHPSRRGPSDRSSG